MSDGIHPDTLEAIAWQAVREADREARGEPEKPEAPPFVYPQDRVDAQIAERASRRNGRDCAEEEKAESERILIRHLAAKYGPSGRVWMPPESAHAEGERKFRELSQSLKTNSITF